VLRLELISSRAGVAPLKSGAFHGALLRQLRLVGSISALRVVAEPW
jgi:hypothetical protein